MSDITNASNVTVIISKISPPVLEVNSEKIKDQALEIAENLNHHKKLEDEKEDYRKKEEQIEEKNKELLKTSLRRKSERLKLKEELKELEDGNLSIIREKVIKANLKDVVKNTFRKRPNNNKSINNNIDSINNDGFIEDLPQVLQNEKKITLEKILKDNIISNPQRRPAKAGDSVNTNLSFATNARNVLDQFVYDSNITIEDVADVERNSKLAALLDSIVNHSLNKEYGMNRKEIQEVEEEKELLLGMYVNNEIELNKMPTNNEDTKKLRRELEDDLIEKYNNFITRTKYGGADLRDYVSNFQDNITQFKKVWGTKLNTKCKSEVKTEVSICYLCQTQFHGKAPGYSVEMEHKLPLTLFNQLVPSFTFFPVEMLYWNKFIKLKHKIPDDLSTEITAYASAADAAAAAAEAIKNFQIVPNEPLIEYIYRFINCQDASNPGWCEGVNQLLNLFVFNMFNNFMRTSLENSRKISRNTLDNMFNNVGSAGHIKHKLFLHTIKLSMFEFAYSHVYCNQMKIAGDFRNPGIRNGFLQKCFFCFNDNDDELKQPGNAGLYSQLKNIPNIEDRDDENYEPSINEKVDHAKPEVERALTNSNGSNGAITFNEEIVSRNEWQYLSGAFYGEPFSTANSVDINHLTKFNTLSSHLKNHFDCFNKMYEEMSKIEVGKQRLPLTNRKIMAYNIVKSALVVNSKLISERLKLLRSDNFKTKIIQKLLPKTKKGGKKIKSNKKTRKKIII